MQAICGWLSNGQRADEVNLQTPEGILALSIDTSRSQPYSDNELRDLVWTKLGEPKGRTRMTRLFIWCRAKKALVEGDERALQMCCNQITSDDGSHVFMIDLFRSFIQKLIDAPAENPNLETTEREMERMLPLQATCEAALSQYKQFMAEKARQSKACC